MNESIAPDAGIEQANDDAIAARLFPSMASGAASAPAEAAADDPEMQAVRDTPEYRMFGVSEAARAVPDNLFERAIGASIEVGGEAIQLDHELAQGALSELRIMAADLDLSTNDMARVSEALTVGESLKADPAQAIAAREAAVEMLNAQHGQEAALAARCARAYVAKNPKLADLLERTGAGDSPQAVSLIARRALSLHKAGRLTLPSDLVQPSRGLYAASKMNP